MSWILMLGLWGLLSATLGFLAQQCAALLEKPRGRALASEDENNLLRFLLRSAFVVMAEPAPGRAVRQAAFTQDLRLRSWRANLLWMALSSLALWLPLALSLVVYRFNSIFVLSMAGLVLVIASYRPRLRGVALVILALGAQFWAIENFLRAAPSFMGMDGSELILWLSDGRPLAVILLFVIAFVVAALLRFQFLFFALTLMLLSIGWISLSGAVLLWLGERAGLKAGDLLRSRKWREGPRRLVKIAAVSALIGAVLGVLIVGVARDSWGPVSLLSGAGAFDRMWSFVILSILSEVPTFLITMAWAHFEAKVPPDDLFERKEGLESWIGSSDLSAGLLRSLERGLEGRSLKIKATRREMNEEEWAQVPPAIRQVSEEESLKIAKLRDRIRTHLSSGLASHPDPLR